MEIKDAMDRLRQAFQEDEGYVISWHANIAMACYDSIGDDLDHETAHRIGNEAASRFMRLAFDVKQ